MGKSYLFRKLKYKFGGYKSCSDNKKDFGRFIIQLLAFMIVILFILYAVGERFSVIALKLSEAELENQVRYEFNIIATECLRGYNERINDILRINYNEEKRIASVSVDFTLLNELKAELTDKLTKYVDGHNEIVCRIPAGALASNNILMAYGFKIPIKVTSAGYVGVEFKDDFISEGVNQTRHRLMLKIVANMKLYTFNKELERKIEIDVPITETINIGDVPILVEQKSE